MIKHHYLHDLAKRRDLEKLKQCIVLALVPGFAALLYGTLGYLAGSALPNAAYVALGLGGLLLLGIGIFCPWRMEAVSSGIRLVTGKLGHYIFAALLSVVYALCFWPLRGLRRMMHQPNLHLAWDSTPPCPTWTAKATQTMTATGQGQKSLLGSAFGVLHYFAMHGNWIFLPVLALLLALGVIMFFAQTSALAPFIYTLF